MTNDIFIYIASICGAFFYTIEIYTARQSYKLLYIVERKEDNKILNFYSIRIRLCNLVYNLSMLCYNYTNNLQTPIIAFSIYLTMDIILFLTRIYFAYVLQYRISTIENVETVNNPIIHNFA